MANARMEDRTRLFCLVQGSGRHAVDNPKKAVPSDVSLVGVHMHHVRVQTAVHLFTRPLMDPALDTHMSMYHKI